MVINHNMSSVYASRISNINTENLQKSAAKLASGDSITSASSDASGLAVSEKMRSQIRGLNQAGKNIENGISFIGTTEGYLSETTDILQRIRELAVQSSNGIFSDSDRRQIQVEVSQLVTEVDRISSQAQFNGLNLLTGAFAKDGPSTMQFQIGANANQSIKINIDNMSSAALGLSGQGQDGSSSRISISTPDLANMAISTVDEALKKVNTERASLGAYQNTMEMASKGIGVAAENLTAADSRIRDTDMAKEMVEYSKDQILSQTSAAMMAQANTQSRNVLALLQ